MIELRKPLVFFDLETTGVALAEDRIIDIAMIKVDPTGTEESFSSLIDPERPIPPEAQAIHHISDEMVRGQPTFKALALRILSFIGDSDLAGFGVLRFDIPMLAAEFKRAGFYLNVEGRLVIDAMTVYHRMEPRNLSAACRFYCGKDLDGAHRAEADARASYEVLLAQLKRYGDLPRDIQRLAEHLNPRDARAVDPGGKFIWRNGKVSFNFGKYRTQALDEVVLKERSYVAWLSKGENISPEIAKICRDALEGKFPAAP